MWVILTTHDPTTGQEDKKRQFVGPKNYCELRKKERSSIKDFSFERPRPVTYSGPTSWPLGSAGIANVRSQHVKLLGGETCR